MLRRPGSAIGWAADTDHVHELGILSPEFPPGPKFGHRLIVFGCPRRNLGLSRWARASNFAWERASRRSPSGCYGGTTGNPPVRRRDLATCHWRPDGRPPVPFRRGRQDRLCEVEG